MPTRKFCELIDNICKTANIPNPQSLYERANIEVDDVRFTLIDASIADRQSVNVYADFGALPPGEMRAKVMFRLLDLNLGCFEQHLPMFAIDRMSDHVFMVVNIPFDPDGADGLLDGLARFAVQAKAWQATYLMPEEADAGMPAADRSGDSPTPQERLMKNARKR